MTFHRPKTKALKPKIVGTDTPLSLSFFVPGDPVPWARAGLQHATGIVYTPARYKEWKQRLVWAARAAGVLPKAPTSQPIELACCFYFAEPKSFRTTKGALSAEGLRHVFDGELRCTVHTDRDNLLKAVCDAFNGLIWVDDCQIDRGPTDKVYALPGEPAGVQIAVRTPQKRGAR